MIDFSRPYLDALDQAWAEHIATKPNGAPTVISTFAGCGGSSLGYSMAGFRELAAVEWDENAAAILRLNFPGAHVFQGDINQVSSAELMQAAGIKAGELDVFDGSPPCQGFSTAGRRDFSDSRNVLFEQFARLLKDLQPKVFVMENVSGMVKGAMKLIFVEILKTLKSCGYRVNARVLNAKWYGVPQSRERIIFIGCREDLGVEPNHPKPLTGERTLWQAIGHLGNVQIPEIGHVWIDESPNEGGRNTKTWLAAEWAKEGEKYAGHKKRMKWDSVASSLITNSMTGNSYLRSSDSHPKYTRGLSPLEYRLVGSFPQQFVFTGNEVHKRVGNSVPPLFMRAIALHIRNEILKR